MGAVRYFIFSTLLLTPDEMSLWFIGKKKYYDFNFRIYGELHIKKRNISYAKRGKK